MGAETNYIFGETASWVVNGVNTSFTLVNEIDRIEEIYLGGASYRSFSFSGSTITLTDAPTTETWAPVVDYWQTSTYTTPGSVTFWNVIDDVYLRLSQERTSRQFPLTLVKTYINEGIRVLNNYKQNPKDKIGSYSFNKAPDFTVSSYSATQLLSWAITATVPSSGKAIVKYWDVVDYTSRTAWVSLNGLTNLGITYIAWDKISVWYALPSLVKTVGEVIMDRRILTFADKREFIIDMSWYKYTIIDGYLFLPYSWNSDDVVTVNYTRNNNECIAESDIVDISQDYFHVLSLYSLYNILMDREDDRWQVQKDKFETQFKWYRSFISKQTNWINNRIPSAHLRNF